MDEIRVFGIVVLMFSIVVHEYAHGWMALRCGDPTAEMSGRLTLNPIPHIDPVGTIIVPAFLFLSGSGMLFGWAKPVPVNPYNYHNPGLDNVKVSAAGPISNIILALIFTAGCIISVILLNSVTVFKICQFGIQINLILALFNMIPLTPLDGSHILEYYLPKEMQNNYYKIQKFGPVILLFLVMSGFLFGFSILWMILMPPLQFFYGILMSIVRLFV